jgi:hypothetical protein
MRTWSLSRGEERVLSAQDLEIMHPPTFFLTQKFFGAFHMNILHRFIECIISEHAQQVEFFDIVCKTTNEKSCRTDSTKRPVDLYDKLKSIVLKHIVCGKIGILDLKPKHTK